MLTTSCKAACGVRAMKSDNTKSDHQSEDVTRASGFLRSRWHQWLTRRGGVKASYLVGQPTADGVTKADVPAAKARAAAKHADNATSRNAQNCTFEVF